MFTERSAARVMFITPLVPVELLTRQLPETCRCPEQLSKVAPEKSIDGRALYVLDNGMPCSRAAAAVNALKVDPAWKPWAPPMSGVAE